MSAVLCMNVKGVATLNLTEGQNSAHKKSLHLGLLETDRDQDGTIQITEGIFALNGQSPVNGR